MATNEVVIQLAKFNDKSSTNNAEWKNHISESLTVNEGDTIIVSKAFVDTREIASQNIVIAEDMELELEFYFYWINDSNPGDNVKGFDVAIQTDSENIKEIGNVWWQYPDPSAYTGDPGKDAEAPNGVFNPFTYTYPDYSVQLTLQSEKNITFNPDVVNQAKNAGPNIINASQNVLFADGRPYVMCYSDNKPYTQTWKHTLKKGSYSPDQLASLLTLAMAEVSKDKAIDLENNQTNNWFSSGQPFIANTANYPPIWAVSADTHSDSSFSPGDYEWASLVTGQPFLQIDAVRGLPTDDDWKRSTLKSSLYYDPKFNDDPNGLGPPIQKPEEDLPPNPSLCFKNFISDAPTPNPDLNLPDLPVSDAILANQMIVNNYYEITVLGDTLWKISGDTNSTPAVGDKFVCTKTGTLPPNPIIGINKMVIGTTYEITNLGNVWNGEYDTNWVDIGAVLPNSIDQSFTCASNTALQTTTDITTIDVNNRFIFTEIRGYDLSTIGGPSLPETTPVNVDINTIGGNDWVYVVKPSPIFRGLSPAQDGIDYIQIMANPNIPLAGTQYISVIEMSNYAPINMTLTQLNAINIGMKVRVTTTGLIPWNELGAESITAPFDFIVSELPTAPYTDTSWVAQIIPVTEVYVINNYTFPINAFQPTASLKTNVINPYMSANVVSTGKVQLHEYSQGQCIESFNPEFPNFYIYPLVKQQYLNQLSWNPGNPIDAFWGGPCVSYAFPTIGSTEIELAFDDTKNRFIWNYTHSPIQQGEAPSNAGAVGETTFSNVVGIINSFTPATTTAPFESSICKLTSQSGLMFKKMNPPNFWHKILGFSEELLVTDEQLGFTTDGSLKPLGKDTLERFTYERFNSITTRDILSTAMNFNDSADFPNSQPSYVPNLRANTAQSGQIAGPVQLLYEPVINSWSSNDIGYDYMSVIKTNGLKPTTNPPEISAEAVLNAEWFQALDETISIQAIKNPQIITNEYGHYLISITGYGDDKNGMLNQTMKIDSKAILSNYYVNQGSFTSLTFPDSQVYTHIGESLSLNNFSVRIIDPDNMQTITGLGDNTSVYIQINKQYSKQELEQTTEV